MSVLSRSLALPPSGASVRARERIVAPLFVIVEIFVGEHQTADPLCHQFGERMIHSINLPVRGPACFITAGPGRQVCFSPTAGGYDWA